MLKNEFIEKVARDVNAPFTRTKPWVEAVLASLEDALIHEDEVRIVGFGTFEHVARKARKGRNASTGESLDIPARTVVKFTPAGRIAKEVAPMPVAPKE